MIFFDEASALLCSVASPLEVVTVSLDEAHGHILAAPVVAQIDSPRRDVSSMDGYAVREADLPGPLRVVGEAAAGGADPPALARGTAVRIFTGGPVPPGAERIVIQEIVERDGEQASVAGDPGEALFIRARGCDFAAGDTLIPAGTKVGRHMLVAAAAADLAELSVWRRPRVALLSTGDELAAPGTARADSISIPDSISIALAAAVRQWGGDVVIRERLRDEPAMLERAASEALAHADLVVVTGGASVGARDYAKAMFAPFDPEFLFSKVAIKPGKPVWLARAGGRLILGLPGNPTSAMVTARLFLAPLLAGLTGSEPLLQWAFVPVAQSLAGGGDRETFIRARWSNGAADPLGNQDSGAQAALAKADLLIRRRIGVASAGAGDVVETLDF